MKLPYRKNVVIPKEKLVDYLLSMTHPKGQSKARLFRGWGFNENNIDKLERELRKIANSRKVVDFRATVDTSGTNYVVDGKISIPTGGIRSIRTVWYIRIGQRSPRLVTATPLK